SEPYGDPAMSVDLLVEPGHPEAQAGYIIMEAMGYPLYSGSNTLCVATVLLESGMLPMADGPQQLVLESPAGLARITAVTADGRVESVTTQGEPAYVAERGLSVDVPEYGPVGFDLVWSGAYYAMIDAAAHGFALTADEQIALSAFGDAFVRTARPGLRQEHPSLGDLGPLPFVHVMGPVEVTADGRRVSRSATYVHPGVICRSPTGTGTSARLALLAGQGEIGPGATRETASPRGHRFTGTLGEAAQVGPSPRWRSRITRPARLLGPADCPLRAHGRPRRPARGRLGPRGPAERVNRRPSPGEPVPDEPVPDEPVPDEPVPDEPVPSAPARAP